MDHWGSPPGSNGIRTLMNWEEVMIQGYCILNEECKAAKLTKANAEITKEEVAAYAIDGRKDAPSTHFLFRIQRYIWGPSICGRGKKNT